MLFNKLTMSVFILPSLCVLWVLRNLGLSESVTEVSTTLKNENGMEATVKKLLVIQSVM